MTLRYAPHLITQHRAREIRFMDCLMKKSSMLELEELELAGCGKKKTHRGISRKLAEPKKRTQQNG